MACVALASLKATIKLEFLQPIPRVPLHDQPSIQSFIEKISSLQSVLDKSSGGAAAAIKDLEIQIRDFALKAEDDIEIQLSNYVLAKDDREYREKASQQLHQTLQEAAENATQLLNIFNSISNEAHQQHNETQPPIQYWLKHDSASENENGSSRFSPQLVGQMVGRDYDRREIIRMLSTRECRTETTVISIVGMVGIGKTTLAKSVYGDPHVKRYFDVRGWVTMPQEYKEGQALFHLLQSITQKGPNQITKGDRYTTPDELADQVCKYLSRSESYLFVLDNFCNNQAWDEIQRFFTVALRGSSIRRAHILLTTTHFNLNLNTRDFSTKIHNMTLLDRKESWELFCSTLSLKQCMAPEFEGIKSQVLEVCDGLPWLIVEVAKRLFKCNNILKKWEKIKKEIESLGILDRKALTHSYNQLPQVLKVCFLYFGVFPKRKEIQVEKLIGLWIEEGFFEQIEDGDLENQGYVYLKQLIDRSLVLVCNLSYDSEIKSCRMHTALHSFCVGEAQKEGIFCAVNTLQHSGLPLSEFANSCRWLSLYRHSFDYYVLFSTNKSRSIFFFDNDPESFVPFKLLRVLAFVPSLFLQRVSMHLGNLIFLRYLSISQRFEGLGNLVSNNPNLHTLIVSHDEPQIEAPTIHLPSKIWEFPQWRSLELGDMYTVDPPSGSMVNEKLETLSLVMGPAHCGKGVYLSCPNIKKLKIFYKEDLEPCHTHGSSSNPIILDMLDNLERVKKLTISISAGCTVTLPEQFIFSLKLRELRLNGVGCTVTLPEQFMFSLKLRELRLSGINLSGRHLNVIGKLEELKVLKLENTLSVREWCVGEGAFIRLNFLHLEDKKLKQWKAYQKSFCSLEHLILRFCVCLEKIDEYLFIEHTQLKTIELDRCNPSIVVAFMRIQDEQLRLGRYGLDGLPKLKIHKAEDEQPSYPLSEFALVDELQTGALTMDFPIKISELSQSRHHELTDVYIVDPPIVVEGKLKTLSLMLPSHLCEKVYFSFPNLKKLKIFYKQDLELHPNGSCNNIITLDNLDNLEQLESLTISFSVGCNVTVPKWSMFDDQLKKLRLRGTNLFRRDLMAIGRIRGLKVLKLENVLLGRQWDVKNHEFYNLRFLLLEDKKLERLNVDRCALLSLQHLVLRLCYCLKELPMTSALKLIELDRCNPSVVASAKQFQDKQQKLRSLFHRRLVEIKIQGPEYDESGQIVESVEDVGA